MIVALDASCAFDLVQRPLLLQNLKAIGAGNRVIAWFTEYLNKRTSQVAIEGEVSEEWHTDTGVIQGAPLSPDEYNIVSISLPLWVRKKAIDVANIQYADDGVSVITAESIEECEEKAQVVINSLVDWFRATGLSLNAAKSEMIGFGFNPRPLMAGDDRIVASDKIKFLGVQIQSNLKWDLQVKNVARQIRLSANRIRHEGRHLKISDRRILYNSWINGRILSNGLAYLPWITSTETSAGM